MKAELFIKASCVIGEGPVWDEKTGELWFVDVLGQKVLCSRGVEPERVLSFDQPVGFAVLREEGGLLLGMRDGFFLCSSDGSLIFIGDPEPGRKDGRLNDGKADPAGRVFGGTMCMIDGEGEKAESGLFRIGPDRCIHRCLDRVMQANGMGWNKEGNLFYFVDTLRYTVSEYRYDLSTGELSEGRVCISTDRDAGLPDGMCVDDEGMIWLAFWGGWGIVRYDPSTGNALERIELPCPNVTSCCFGGDELNELYITTASILTDTNKYPLAGSVFKALPGVNGRPSFRFRG